MGTTRRGGREVKQEMKNISKFLLAILVLAGLLAAFDAYAAWSTRARLRCDRGVNASITVTLTLDGQPIAQETIACISGQSETLNIITHQKPNDWEISGTVNGQPCSGSGTSFPARVRCTTSPEGATIQIGHSREVEGI